MADPNEKPSFVMKVSEKLFLDNLGKYTASPPKGVPVYGLGGGILSLSPDAKSDVLSGKLSLIYNQAEPGWATKVRALGFDQDMINLFSKVGELMGLVATVIGVWEAATKLGQMLGIFKTGPTLEAIAEKILKNTEDLKLMQAGGLEQTVKLALDTARAPIATARGDIQDIFNQLEHLAIADRVAHRQTMIATLGATAGHVNSILMDSRWRLFCIPSHYAWTWGATNAWYPVFLSHIKALNHDGTAWVDAAFPVPSAPRFDPRAALPHAIQAITSYLVMLSMTEPEYRSTGLGRGSLIEFANQLRDRLADMRKILVRTVKPASEFTFEIEPEKAYGLLGKDGFVRPFGIWKVGAADLTGGTDAYYLAIAQGFVDKGETPPSKLGSLDWDWVPDPVDLVWHDTNEPFSPPCWKIADPQAAAGQANAQSELDYVIVLQSSGYLELARLEACLRHLATDPERSETVRGTTQSTRHWVGSRPVEIVGVHGAYCNPSAVTATVPRDDYEPRSTVSLQLQPPDRANQIPTRLLLVALNDDVNSAPWAPVLSEAELATGPGQTVTLPSVRTYDRYIRLGPSDPPSPLNPAATKYTKSGPAVPLKVTPAMLASNAAPQGFGPMTTPLIPAVIDASFPAIHRKREMTPLTLKVDVHRWQTQKDRGGTVTVAPAPGSRSYEHLYVAVEETLASGAKLRTYFDVSGVTQVYWVPNWFFVAEEECAAKTKSTVDYVDTHYTESQTILPPNVPVEAEQIQKVFNRLRAKMPEAVERAARELGLSVPPIHRD